MNAPYKLEAIHVDCPYCGEIFTTTVDTSIEQQSYTEDCQICCSPILFNVFIHDNGHIDTSLAKEND